MNIAAKKRRFVSNEDKIQSPQDKFVEVRKLLNETLIEREEEVSLILTALLARQHVLLVGEPGTGKSLVVDNVKEWIDGARKFTVHCCKDTLRNMTFGPVKLSALKQDRAERNLEGGAADCHLLLLEEVFKAGPAVLDTFLLMMNERVYVEGLVRKQTPLQSIFGVSNEWSPEGCEAALAAFFDRFLFRKAVNPIRSRDGKRVLLAKAVDCDNCRPVYDRHLTLEELEQAQEEVNHLPWSNDAKRGLWEILEGLTKEGVNPGDRRQYQSVGAVRAYAYLNGATEVLPEHLEILQHVLWIDPTEQPKTVARIVQQVANPVGMLVNSNLIKVEDVLAKCKPTDAVPKLQAIAAELKKLKSDPRVDKALDYVSGCIRDSYEQVLGRKVGEE